MRVILHKGDQDICISRGSRRDCQILYCFFPLLDLLRREAFFENVESRPHSAGRHPQFMNVFDILALPRTLYLILKFLDSSQKRFGAE
jgi:hypothetical protein